MDFSSLNMTTAADKGALLYVKHPSTKKVMNGVTIELLGIDSTIFNKKKSELVRLFAEGKSLSKEDTERENLEGWVALTKNWSGVVWEGKPLECTPENVRMLYGNPGFRWLLDQVIEFVNNRANFLASASVN